MPEKKPPMGGFLLSQIVWLLLFSLIPADAPILTLRRRYFDGLAKEVCEDIQRGLSP